MKTLKYLVRKKFILIAIATVVVLGCLGFAMEKNNVTHLTSISRKGPSKAPVVDNPKAQTTSRAPTAQGDYSGGSSSRQAGNTLNENRGSGIVTDNKGVVNTPSSQSTWTVSTSGEITVYTPAKDAVLTSGSIISGGSTLSVVSFRLIDNITGQISTGKISVVSGKFSGTATFNTNAKIGQLDIFATKADGTEFSNISIPVRFN